MKGFKKLVSMTVAVTILTSLIVVMGGGTANAFTAKTTDTSDSWSAVSGLARKTVITREEFDEGFSFVPYGTLKDGTWERFQGDADDEGNTVTVSDGKITISPTLGTKSGIRLKFPAQTGTTVFMVKARRTNNEYTNHLSLKVDLYYDKANRYSYISGSNFLGMDPAKESETSSSESEDYSRS